jgi:two-component system, cell cycle response regulator DivK
MSKVILIVEIDDLSMKLIADVLEAGGYETVQTRNSRDALERARHCPPDLIVIDIHQPGLSDIDIKRALESEVSLKGIPLIATTPFARREDEVWVHTDCCDGFIPQPISVSNILDTVASFLH